MTKLSEKYEVAKNRESETTHQEIRARNQIDDSRYKS